MVDFGDGGIIGGAVGAVGLLIAWMQHLHNVRRERMETTLSLIRQLQETEARRARYQARDIMESQAAREGRFQDLSPEDRSILSSLASVFGLAGLLMKKGRLDTEVFVGMYGLSLIVNYERLEPYRTWRIQRYGAEDGSAWALFEAARDAARKQLGRGAAKI